MSEPTLAALAAVGGPLLKEAEAALAPEAEKVLTDLREFVSGEADKLRTEVPAVVEQGVAHLHNLGAAILNRYHAVMEHIDAHLAGATPAAPEPPAVPLATGGLVTPPSVSVDPTQPATDFSSTSPATSDPTIPPSDGSSTNSATPSADTTPAAGTDTPAV